MRKCHCAIRFEFIPVNFIVRFKITGGTEFTTTVLFPYFNFCRRRDSAVRLGDGKRRK